MIDNYKVVCITPAGRKRYLSILQHYVRKSFGLVDEWHLWQNTGNETDIDYINQLAKEDARIKILKIDEPGPFNSGRIRSFFIHAAVRDTIYVRFDDDIVWLDDNAIQNIVSFRLTKPQYFLISGNVVNNPVCTYRHKKIEALNFPEEVLNCYNDMLGLTRLGVRIHSQFLATEDKTKFYLPSEVLPIGQRFGIQFISWFGSEFNKFEGILPHRDEEEWLTREKPYALGIHNAICGNALASHFAYTEQRLGGDDWVGIDQTDLLERYAKLAGIQ